MSNAKLVKDRNIKKYGVEEFCKKYNSINIEETKNALIKNVMNSHYVSYETKITVCEKIIDNSYYKKTEKEGVKIKKLHINSPAQYMLYCLYLINQYTHITIDFSKSLDEFNLLNECGLLDILCNCIPEKELKEFRMILDMVENDVLQNEYETHAFISNQIERFGELFGYIAKPALDRLSDVIVNMDEKTIDKMVGKLKGLSVFKDKFNIIK